MNGEAQQAGPLTGVRVIELAAQGPVPFCAMMLADMGARVLRIGRPGENAGTPSAIGLAPRDDVLLRHREHLAVDLKDPDGIARVRQLTAEADVLIEGFRPGVAERLGLGPEVLLASHPSLVYARLTGWGQTGPNARLAGHDINFLAATGALAALGRPGTPPAPPLNLVADFGGGGMFGALGIVAALYEARRSGQGQVVDAAMVDGVGCLMSTVQSLRTAGMWSNDRGANALDGGAPWYDCYETADGRYIALGCVEPQFFQGMTALLELDPAYARQQFDRQAWPSMRRAIAERIRAQPWQAWVMCLADTDLCITPVWHGDEAARLPALRARGSHIDVNGQCQPAPAPRFSRTPGRPGTPAPPISPSA
ncbi:CaiB/BaiF CoA transferase family protein [Variovorax sp. PBL-E5]|uniref:CaiB/BaiF CoA transferase family protein n=1 Tax=Variovorax sp. PBL-E5 TaxID=434014 RepID=UPI001316DCDA|nr:CaiB/BaiF CoA-transferase family protein [Variovorax sp. PBL-E5]VTU20862.1 Formyl-coenzyme A transferase [Variovorax sp. PBL-E5]